MYVQRDLAFSELYVGRLREALSVVNRNLEIVAGNPHLLHYPRSAFSYGAQSNLRSLLLIYLGRLDQASEHLSRVTGSDRDLGILHPLHSVRTELAVASGDASLALAAAQEVATIAKTLGETLFRARADHCLGLAYSLNEAWEEAVEALERSISTARRNRTFLYSEARVLADLAEAHLGYGQDRRARPGTRSEWGGSWRHKH